MTSPEVLRHKEGERGIGSIKLGICFGAWVGLFALGLLVHQIIRKCCPNCCNRCKKCCEEDDEKSEGNDSAEIIRLGDADSIVHSARDHDTPQIHHESYEMDDQDSFKTTSTGYYTGRRGHYRADSVYSATGGLTNPEGGGGAGESNPFLSRTTLFNYHLENRESTVASTGRFRRNEGSTVKRLRSSSSSKSTQAKSVTFADESVRGPNNDVIRDVLNRRRLSEDKKTYQSRTVPAKRTTVSSDTVSEYSVYTYESSV